MSNTISRFFRAAFTTSTPAPLGGRTISRPQPLAAGVRQVTATDFLSARQMIAPTAGQSAWWQGISKGLRSTLVHDVIGSPQARQGGITRRGNLMLMHIQHAGLHLSASEQRQIGRDHAVYLLGQQHSITDKRGGNHTFVWALPYTPALAAKASAAPVKPAMPGTVPHGFVLGIGGLEGPARGETNLLGLPPPRAYLGRYGS